MAERKSGGSDYMERGGSVVWRPQGRETKKEDDWEQGVALGSRGGAYFSTPANRKPDGLNERETRLPRRGPSYSGNHPVSQNQAMISPAPHEETELSAVADYNR